MPHVSEDRIAGRIAEPLLGGSIGVRLSRAGAGFLRVQAYIFAAVLGLTTLLALALQGPCLSNGYAEPSASARMCAGPLSTAFLGQLAPESPGRASGGAAGLSVIDGRLVTVFRALTDDVSVFMAFVLLINVIGIAALGVGLLVLARHRAWLLGFCLAPMILFTLGSTLDPLALALAVWAIIVFLGSPPVTARGWLAGVLIAFAAFINPLALCVLVALSIAGPNPVRPVAPRKPQLMIAATAITSALILVADGTAVDRILHWFTDAVDAGSFASILVMIRIGSAEVWAWVWICASAAVVVSVAIALWAVRRNGLDPAVATALLIGGCLLLAPGLMLWDSLWLLPFLVLSINRWWVLIVWGVVEATFAIAVHLGDITASEPDAGLDPAFIALFTLLRLFALVVTIIFAGENLYQRRVRAAFVTPKSHLVVREAPLQPDALSESAPTITWRHDSTRENPLD